MLPVFMLLGHGFTDSSLAGNQPVPMLPMTGVGR